MTPHWTEARIREFLDGTWTHVAYDGRVITDILNPGEEPPIARGGRPKGVKNVRPHAFWTPQDDDLIVTQRRRNMPFCEIAWLVNRTEESTKKRYKVLRARGQV